MFTGIIQSMGEVAALQPKGDDLRLHIRTGKLALADVVIGDSIATSGVCLTVVELPGDGFWADVSGETLACTRTGELKTGDRVNLEKALTLSTPLGGHLVSGHVDGLGEVVSRHEDGRSVRFRMRAPDSLAHYIAAKGSVCVDGISLTVNAVDGAEFELNIVPHTLVETTMGEFRPGRTFNLEVDIIARYLERLLLGQRAAQPGSEGVTEELLQRCGFMGAADRSTGL
ncbi:Riboflavin synthase eubacterial/eukaryotic [hydrothermal vent metagenome]|uniref:Riboflavin synthase n=1 Tax=hydrothermal vent metagenome TaxID=652676 RepID=A0A3B0ZM46_9ZZZZ